MVEMFAKLFNKKVRNEKIDWTSNENVTTLWDDLKNEEPLCQLATAKIKDKILPPDHPIQPNALRVVAVSDTHSKKLSHLDLPQGDVLIHAGDLTMFGSQHEFQELNVEFGKLLASKCYRKIVAIAGNHDEYLEDFFTLSSQPTKQKRTHPLTNCIYLLDESVTICGVKIYGSPWVPVYRRWAFQLNRGEQLDKNWQAIPDDTDILVTHTPPLGALDLSKSNKRAGCLSLTGHVLNRVKPKFHIFGHIHECHGVLALDNGTTFINAAICNASYQARNHPVVFDVPIPDGHSKRELFANKNEATELNGASKSEQEMLTEPMQSLKSE